MWKYSKLWSALDPKVRKSLLEEANLSQDGASAAFGTLSGPGGSSSSMAVVAAALPPVGACTIVPSIPNFLRTRSRALNSGSSLALTGPAGQTVMPSIRSGQYQGLFGAALKGPSVPPGVYTITAKGGKDVGPFTASLNACASVVWTNKVAMPFFDRTQPLTVTWSGGPAPGHVLIGGYQNGAMAFFCTEDTSRGTFSVQAVFLSVFKPAVGQVTLLIGQHPLERPIAIPGLDIAWFMDLSSDSITVPVR